MYPEVKDPVQLITPREGAIQRTGLCVGIITLVATGSLGPSARLAAAGGEPYRESVALVWNAALLDAVRAVRFAPMFTARGLAIVHTCMYDAWAAYDARAVGTVFGGALRRPGDEQTLAAKEVAVSYAAFRALVDLFPSRRPVFEAIL